LAVAGRRPDLIPDGEVWNNLVIELRPDKQGGAEQVWQWSVWDHLVQDFDPKKANFDSVAAHPELVDINFCPPGGKFACRNRDLLRSEKRSNPSQLITAQGPSKTGEKDWLHINAVSYDPIRDQVVMSVNIACEFIIVDHGLTTAEAQGHTGGKRGKGGDILYRFGNPQVSRCGDRMGQVLFCQHSVQFLRDVPGDGNILLFNNGRAPDRLWSTVDEFKLPDDGGVYLESTASKPPHWSFGPPIGRRGSFYCTHISGCQRLPNGNTLVIQGPQGIIVEATPDGEEVWRYVNPVMIIEGGVAYVRQGDQRTTGRFSLFSARRYPRDYAAFNAKENKQMAAALSPGRRLEA